MTIGIHCFGTIKNFNVRRILVNQGSSVDKIYCHLFNTLQLNETHLTPNVGFELQGFNGSVTKRWGYVEIIVTFGAREMARSIKTQFLVVDFPSLY